MKNGTKLFQFVLFFLFLKSLNAWFTWEMDNFFMIFQLLFSIPFIFSYRDKFIFSKYLVIILLYSLAIFFMGTAKDFGGILGFFCNIIPLIVFICTRSSFKIYTLRIITRWWLYIMIPSLVLFLLSFVIIIPDFGKISNSSWDQYVYNNHLLLIKSPFYGFRFHSIFLEPGHIGMIISFFLYALKFDFKKWEVWALLVIELFTLSLAGYLLVAIGYIFSSISKGKSVYNLLLIIGLLFGSIYVSAISYNNGNNMINILIFDRLAYDDEKGVAGNNRFGRFADELIESKFENGDFWFGTSKKIIEGEFLGAGWKVYLIKYGLFSLLFFIGFYFCFLFKTNDKRYVLFFILLLFFAFLQRAYPYWYAWNIPFIAGIAFNDVDKFRKKRMLNG